MPQPRRYESAAARQRAYRRRCKAAEKASGAIPPPAPIGAMPSTKRWNALRDCAARALDLLVSEMEQYQGDRSEAWLESDKGEEFGERILAVQDALDALERIP